MKVSIATLIQTNQPMVQLANTPLPAKTKYWVGRISEAANNALNDYEKKRVALVQKMGVPVRFEPQPHQDVNGVSTPQPPKVVELTDPAEIIKPGTPWQVKKEDESQFMAKLDEWQAVEVDLGFHKIKLSNFGDSPIPVNIAALTWMVDDNA